MSDWMVRDPRPRRAGGLARLRHCCRRGSSIVLCLVSAVVASVVLIGPATAQATSSQSTVLSPVDGTVSSAPSEPHHTPYGGDYSWDIHTSGQKRPVYARFRNTNGSLSLSVASVGSACTAGFQFGGNKIVLNVYINGAKVGTITYRASHPRFATASAALSRSEPRSVIPPQPPTGWSARRAGQDRMSTSSRATICATACLHTSGARRRRRWFNPARRDRRGMGDDQERAMPRQCRESDSRVGGGVRLAGRLPRRCTHAAVGHHAGTRRPRGLPALPGPQHRVQHLAASRREPGATRHGGAAEPTQPAVRRRRMARPGPPDRGFRLSGPRRDRHVPVPSACPVDSRSAPRALPGGRGWCVVDGASDVEGVHDLSRIAARCATFVDGGGCANRRRRLGSGSTRTGRLRRRTVERRSLSTRCNDASAATGPGPISGSPRTACSSPGG